MNTFVFVANVEVMQTDSHSFPCIDDWTSLRAICSYYGVSNPPKNLSIVFVWLFEVLKAGIFLFFASGGAEDWMVGWEGNLVSGCEMGFPLKGCEEEEMDRPVKVWKSCLSLPPSPS